MGIENRVGKLWNFTYLIFMYKWLTYFSSRKFWQLLIYPGHPTGDRFIIYGSLCWRNKKGCISNNVPGHLLDLLWKYLEHIVISIKLLPHSILKAQLSWNSGPQNGMCQYKTTHLHHIFYNSNFSSKPLVWWTFA